MGIKIALAGNPNAGKTTLFNALTGSNQFVGNWPGVTVEKKEGKLKGHKDVVSDNWDGGRYTPTGSWAYAATTKTEHIEAATELVKWMSGVDSGVLLYEKTKSMPSTYAAYDQITTFEEDENYKALYEQLRDYGHPRPKTPVYPQVSTSFQQVLEDVGLSGKNVTNEMDKSVERINAKLKRYTR